MSRKKEGKERKRGRERSSGSGTKNHSGGREWDEEGRKERREEKESK